jgi:hypothetical protein
MEVMSLKLWLPAKVFRCIKVKSSHEPKNEATAANEAECDSHRKPFGCCAASRVKIPIWRRAFFSVAWATLWALLCYYAYTYKGPYGSTIWTWTLGFAVALGAGQIVTRQSLDALRWWVIRKAEKRNEGLGDAFIVPLYLNAALFSLIERLFFTLLVAFDVSGTATAMMAWIALKMATDWHRILGSAESRTVGERSLAFCGVTGGIISLVFAFIGGKICRIENTGAICGVVRYLFGT